MGGELENVPAGLDNFRCVARVELRARRGGEA